MVGPLRRAGALPTLDFKYNASRYLYNYCSENFMEINFIDIHLGVAEFIKKRKPVFPRARIDNARLMFSVISFFIKRISNFLVYDY